MSDRYRVSFYIHIKGDTEVEARNHAEALNLVEAKVREIIKREYDDQRSGLEKQEGDDGCYYGLTLRLPGDMLIYDISYTPDESVFEGETSRPRLNLVRGSCKRDSERETT